MPRVTGTFRTVAVADEQVRAFVPRPLPPVDPALVLDERLATVLSDAMAALGRLAVAAEMVPSADWFLYGFVRKEAVISSRIEGTQATLQDVLTFEATERSDRPDDVREVCNYVDALSYARRQIARPKGLPLSARLLCQIHKRLMHGARGQDRQPGRIRRSQNWVGGSAPGTAAFVPPPPDAVPDALDALEQWIHSDDALPPLVRAGLAHVQFETIHPFLDGNGRIGRLLITLLLEHWNLMTSPLLYLSVAFNRHRSEYYDRLNEVRTEGRWEGWTAFFLRCVHEAAEDCVTTVRTLFALIGGHRRALLEHEQATVTAVRLFDQLPSHPIVTLQRVTGMLETTKPTASKAIATLCAVGILEETSGRRRDRVFAYRDYLRLLSASG